MLSLFREARLWRLPIQCFLMSISIETHAFCQFMKFVLWPLLYRRRALGGTFIVLLGKASFQS
jgi:hypothetical protein